MSKNNDSYILATLPEEQERKYPAGHDLSGDASLRDEATLARFGKKQQLNVSLRFSFSLQDC